MDSFIQAGIIGITLGLDAKQVNLGLGIGWETVLACLDD